MSLQRRQFLEQGAAAGLAALLGPQLWAELNESMGDGGHPLPRRPLGKTGENLSVIGLGGIVVIGGTQRDADNRVAEAIDRGVNYFDVAPSYGKGEAEEKLGPALKPYRNGVFLACKTGMRDKEGAAAELETSLRRLQTDHVDLYQMHSLTDVEGDVKRALGPGGAMETFLDAREKGKTRFLGFSAHSVEAAQLAMKSGLFDTILYPVNFVCHFQSQFDQKVLEDAASRGMGRLALKSMARTRWPEGVEREGRTFRKCWYEPLSDAAEGALALRWTLSRGVTAAIPPGDENLFRVALNVASVDKPLEPKEVAALEKLASGVTPIFPQAPKRKREKKGPGAAS